MTRPPSKPVEVGARATVYFHGQPGSADELTLFGGAAPSGWFAPVRSFGGGPRRHAVYFDDVANQVRAHSGNRPVKLVGFSIGAYLALEVAARLPDLDLSIDLISPAAPLSIGPFLQSMAGKAVFDLAARRPQLFSAVAIVQGLMARTFPGALCNLLFASAQGGDAALYADPLFRAGIAQVVRRGLGENNATYRNEIAGYVSDWAPVLRKIDQPVAIWQGQCDNWSPPTMAEALASTLPNVQSVHRFDKCSHYSTLRDYLRAAG